MNEDGLKIADDCWSANKPTPEAKTMNREGGMSEWQKQAQKVSSLLNTTLGKVVHAYVCLRYNHRRNLVLTHTCAI